MKVGWGLTKGVTCYNHVGERANEHSRKLILIEIENTNGEEMRAAVEG